MIQSYFQQYVLDVIQFRARISIKFSLTFNFITYQCTGIVNVPCTGKMHCNIEGLNIISREEIRRKGLCNILMYKYVSTQVALRIDYRADT